MAYTPVNFVDGVTPLNAANLNHLEDQIEALSDAPAGGTDLSYEGTHVPATSHQDGDLVVKDGILYMAVKPTTSTPDPAPWGAVGAPNKIAGELAYTETAVGVTAPVGAPSAGIEVVSLGSVTYDGSPILIEFYADAVLTGAAANAAVGITLWDGATLLGELALVRGNTAGASVHARRRLTPTPGPHTYLVKAHSGASGGVAGSIAAGVGTGGANMPAFIRASLAQPTIVPSPGQAIPIAYGTSLPVSPVDGQEAILVDSLTNPSYIWRFRYNAGSASAYKWEFVGGAPLQAAVSASLSFSGTSFADIAGSPQIVVPRAGDYTVDVGGGLQLFSAGSADIDIRTWDGTTQGVRVYVSALQLYMGGSVSAVERRLAMAAGATLRLQGKVASAGLNAGVQFSYLSLAPVRVA
jgi:hypothetical protein